MERLNISDKKQTLKIKNTGNSELLVIIEPFCNYETVQMGKSLLITFSFIYPELESIDFNIEYELNQITILLNVDIKFLDLIKIQTTVI